MKTFQPNIQGHFYKVARTPVSSLLGYPAARVSLVPVKEVPLVIPMYICASMCLCVCMYSAHLHM